MRMAIVGSGAAAAGALHALFGLAPDAAVVIYGTLKRRYGRGILPT